MFFLNLRVNPMDRYSQLLYYSMKSPGKCAAVQRGLLIEVVLWESQLWGLESFELHIEGLRSELYGDSGTVYQLVNLILKSHSPETRLIFLFPLDSQHYLLIDNLIVLCPGLVTVDISSSHFILIWGDHGGVTGLSRLRGIKEKSSLHLSCTVPWMRQNHMEGVCRKCFLALCCLSHSESLLGHCGLGIGSSFWAPTLAHIAFCFEWNQEILLNTKNIQDLYPSTAIHCNKEGFNKHLLNSNYVPSTVLNAEVITNKGV